MLQHDPSTDRPFEWVLPRLRAALPAQLRRYFQPACCVAATRIVIDVLGYFGIPANPLPVRARVLNSAYIALMARAGGRGPKDNAEAERWKEQGAWEVAIGYGYDERTPAADRAKRWDGHLVVHVPHIGRVIDANIRQAERPQRGIFLPDFIVERVDRKFVRGREPLSVVLQNPLVGVRYEVAAKNTGYLDSPDWNRTGVGLVVGSRVIGMVEQMEEVPA